MSANPHELEAYGDYLQAAGREPENVAALRQWVQGTQAGSR